MNATVVFALGWGLLILGHWANNETTITVQQIVEMSVALVLVTLLDRGETAVIAQGLAWIFLASVLLGNKSILTGLSKIG